MNTRDTQEFMRAMVAPVLKAFRGQAGDTCRRPAKKRTQLARHTQRMERVHAAGLSCYHGGGDESELMMRAAGMHEEPNIHTCRQRVNGRTRAEDGRVHARERCRVEEDDVRAAAREPTT